MKRLNSQTNDYRCKQEWECNACFRIPVYMWHAMSKYILQAYLVRYLRVKV